MKTQPTPTYTVGSVTFQAYEKFGPHIQPAPNGIARTLSRELTSSCKFL